MTKTIAQTEKFIRDRLDSVEAEYEERQAEYSVDSEDRGYFEGIIDAYNVILNHINS
jgi:hypothetical protein